MNVRSLIGSGACGRVWLAENETGELVAVKVFHGIGIAPELLAKTTARLSRGGWLPTVLPVIAQQLEVRPYYRVSPLLADRGTQGEILPRTLQKRLADHPGEGTWPLVQALAGALAALHRQRVVHGNLKPGNVFFSPSGEPLLADWALGNMPGVDHFEFTDAVLYQPPEQLRDPSGYEDERGYRGDVFAFGVLAYRLLTGRFPRCHETFLEVAPAPGEDLREGVRADLTKIARSLESAPPVSWPDEPRNALEKGFRQWIDRCLQLDPALRPATMADLAEGFEREKEREEARRERASLLTQRRRWEARARKTAFAAGLCAAGAVLLAVLWQQSLSQVKQEREKREKGAEAFKNALIAADEAQFRSSSQAESARNQLNYERDLALARIKASRWIGDRLFAWAMEKGHRSLPPLDGRETRLQRLEQSFEDFLNRTADISELAEEHARARLQLAEISLAAGDAEEAQRRLQQALSLADALPAEGEWKLRVASDHLLLALLQQSVGGNEAATAFAEARAALAEVPVSDASADRLHQLEAILDFHEANFLAQNGEQAKALDQLMRATQTLNRLADQNPDSVVLRSELAGCYLSSATILEGIGSMGDAREVRSLAAAEFTKMLQQNPDDPHIRLELAGCYGAIAESALLSGDPVAAEANSRQAAALLQALLREQPDHVAAASRLAEQLGIQAGLLRDRGKAQEAVALFDQGIRLLESARASSPADSVSAYRLALLWWQKGRMLGIEGDRAQEIALISRARDLLRTLESQPGGGIASEQLQRSAAYVLGDLGHVQDLAGETSQARTSFEEAVRLWEMLTRSRPESEEYQEALAWCRQRIGELH